MSRIPVPPERRDSLTPGSPPIPPTPSKRSHRPTSPIGKSGRKPTLPPPPQSCPISSQYKSQKAAQLPRYVPSYIKVSPSPQISKMEEYSITDSFRFVFTSPGMWKDAFKTLYQFYESGQLCDVEVTVGERTFRCHRAVLACASRYFRAMFTGEMAESRQSSVTIQDANVDAESLELLIKYAYLAQVELTVDNVQPLLYAASILQVEPVADACCAFMRKHLHPFNCIAVRNFAEQHGRKELIEIVDDFISEKFVEVSETADFLDLSAATLEQLLQRTDLNVETEAQVYEAVVLWVRHDVEGRGEALAGLMAHVKLPLLSPTFLLQHVETEELMRTNLLCRDFLDEAKYYQMSLVSLVPEVKVTDRIRPRKSYAGVLFCVGGRGVSGDPFRSIECYDVRRDSWFAVSEMSSRRRHVGVCSAGGLVYAVGGHDGSDHLASGEMFDPEINKWKEICPMSTPRRGIALACLGGPIYAVGGLDDNQCYSVVERYDPVSDTWTFVSNMNIPRGGVGVAALKGRLYAVGGNDGATSLDSCETYDPFLNKWTVVSSMSTRRAGAGVAVLNGCLYVVGGFDDNFPLDTAEKYDPKSDTWSTIGRMSHSRGGVGVASLGGLLYAVGGHNGRNYLNSVEAYDPVEDRWLTVADTSEWRAGAGVVFSDTAVRLVQQAAGQRIVSAV